ncbi:MAG: hypothetical protein J6W00_08080, partial [Lentisphaeria bacterium]|nr:hypothetical protein [Lentisphaeria bacterium]
PLLFVQKIDFYKIFPVILIFLLCSPLLTYVVMAAAKFVSQGHYLEDGRSNSVIYTLALSGMILGGICVTRIKDDKTSLIATLVLGLVFTRFFASLEPALFYLNRVGMYFEFCTVAFFPMVLEHKKSFLSNIGIFFVVIFLFIRAYVFFLAPWTGDDKFHYTTVFTKDSYE